MWKGMEPGWSRDGAAARSEYASFLRPQAQLGSVHSSSYLNCPKGRGKKGKALVSQGMKTYAKYSAGRGSHQFLTVQTGLLKGQLAKNVPVNFKLFREVKSRDPEFL